jgi:N-acetylmuramic acid 6-phosphate etherase
MSRSTTLPPDRGHLSTEHRHAGSSELDTLSTIDAVTLMADDHRRAVDAVMDAAPALSNLVDRLAERFRAGGRLIYVGAGTSGRLGVLDASECPPTFCSEPGQVIGEIAGGDAALRKSSESKEDEPDGARDALDALTLTKNDTLLGIAAGGTTPFVLGAIRLARAAGASTGMLTCVAQPTPPEGCDHLIVLDTGPELLTGSTRLKAGTATKLALNIITTLTFVRLGKVYGNLMVDLRATNDKLRDRAIRILIELFPDLTREDAADLLKRADNELKPAIVMRRREVDLEQAHQLLATSQGRLRDVMDL